MVGTGGMTTEAHPRRSHGRLTGGNNIASRIRSKRAASVTEGKSAVCGTRGENAGGWSSSSDSIIIILPCMGCMPPLHEGPCVERMETSSKDKHARQNIKKHSCAQASMIDSMREKLTRMKKRNAAHDENIHALNAHVDELHQQSGVRPGDMNPRPDDKICTGELQVS